MFSEFPPNTPGLRSGSRMTAESPWNSRQLTRRRDLHTVPCGACRQFKRHQCRCRPLPPHRTANRTFASSRVRHVPNGGVLTFGSSQPPIMLYHGPTDRAIVRRRLAKGEPVSAGLGNVSPDVSNAGSDVSGSGNVKRVTPRCTGRSPSRFHFSKKVTRRKRPCASTAKRGVMRRVM